MMTVDPLHEFELGVFKEVLIWLIRIAYKFGADRVQQLNER